ncbi:MULTISPECIES: family 10 glycosylhydrolase [unclassified Micromonospora]|uniref:family 10 glycosylhydrolase n=1 Tax=unclassified Micromonospora TaxID=2617518 RepID=UPI003328AF52
MTRLGGFVVTAIQSIVREYDVDGINLDYVRYPDFNSTTTHSDWGYSETSLARFRAATGRTDTPVPSDPQFSDWRRTQMTNLVRKIYLGMWEVDPQARLSMDGITYSYGPQTMGGWEKTRPYAEVLQDWKGWLAEGIMDTVVAMNYKRNWMPDQKQMYDEWTEVLADWQGDRQAVIGPALYLNDIPDSVEQVRRALAPTAAGNTAAGWSGYSYANPTRAGVGVTEFHIVLMLTQACTSRPAACPCAMTSSSGS